MKKRIIPHESFDCVSILVLSKRFKGKSGKGLNTFYPFYKAQGDEREKW